MPDLTFTRADSDLLEAAKAIQGEFFLRDDLSAASVAAALRTASGRVVTGVCADFWCALGFCAERAAIAELLKHRETAIATIVAHNSHGIVPPCGACRELIVQLNDANLDTRVVLGDRRISLLRDLLPEGWLAERDRIRRERRG